MDCASDGLQQPAIGAIWPRNRRAASVGRRTRAAYAPSAKPTPAAAQAVPGPLFTFAAYLGALASIPPGGAGGAAVALLGIFLPGILILMGTLPFWHELRGRAGARAAMAGVNAAVVGLLATALYTPVFTSAVHTGPDFAVAAAGFVLLVVWRAPPLLVVLACAAAGVGLALGA